MTRSEEELHVGTASREAGRARLRKYVVTEKVQRPFRSSREEVRIEREPITDANVDAAMSRRATISEEEHEVVLHEEEPVVEKRTVPKERVGSARRRRPRSARSPRRFARSGSKPKAPRSAEQTQSAVGGSTLVDGPTAVTNHDSRGA